MAIWSKMKHRFKFPGICGKQSKSNLAGKLNVNEEYKKAFRTQSYADICNKIQGHMERKSMDIMNKLSSSSSSSSPSSSPSSSSIPLFVHLSENLLEPRPQKLDDIIKGHDLHPLLIDYFDVTTESCHLCELLLRSIHQARANHKLITRVIKLNKKAREDHDRYCKAIIRELASFSLKKNPLSSLSVLQFRDNHDSRNILLHGLMLQCQKITRRIKMKNLFKKIVGCSIVVAYTAVTITLLVLAFHAMVGIVATPAVLKFFLGFNTITKRTKEMSKDKSELLFKGNSRERTRAQLDVAAKGVFILINDFNTMSQLVRRLNDEIEHRKAIANMCVRNGKIEVLKEVVREFRIEEKCFLEQLEELEDHIYLCFLTINRSRRLVVEELMHGANMES
ncbi:Single hybrid motif superfamily protein [Heracleum sosnowskyi]|uniref:Single hybrid motif superfamily protein n=1 Tax=Heracleum sosnowskyi TaxID=360622 RepID=A0AAD8IPJ6_9APIA|nr:Single hybrid motif superfamily protein [Heracleum sosnowskyi]